MMAEPRQISASGSVAPATVRSWPSATAARLVVRRETRLHREGCQARCGAKSEDYGAWCAASHAVALVRSLFVARKARAFESARRVRADRRLGAGFVLGALVHVVAGQALPVPSRGAGAREPPFGVRTQRLGRAGCVVSRALVDVLLTARPGPGRRTCAGIRSDAIGAKVGGAVHEHVLGGVHRLCISLTSGGRARVVAGLAYETTNEQNSGAYVPVQTSGSAQRCQQFPHVTSQRASNPDIIIARLCGPSNGCCPHPV